MRYEQGFFSQLALPTRESHYTTDYVPSESGLGFLPLLIGAGISIAGKIAAGSVQKKAAEKTKQAQKKAMKKAKEAMKKRAAAAKAIAAAKSKAAQQMAIASQAQGPAGWPWWVWPVAIGGGVLLLGGTGMLLLKRRRTPQ